MSSRGDCGGLDWTLGVVGVVPGGKAAAFGGKAVVKGAGEWLVRKFHRHHADPKFLGGAQNQTLTELAEETHKNLHRDLNNFLRTKMDDFGNHMRPQRGNSGQVIRQNFSRQERLEALRDFYRGPGVQYTEAARDFFRQHPGL